MYSIIDAPTDVDYNPTSTYDANGDNFGEALTRKRATSLTDNNDYARCSPEREISFN